MAMRRFGIDIVGMVEWGRHLCQFYQTREDLVETLVPYFREGLHSNEYCMWITSPPLEVEEAKHALRAVPDLDDYLVKGQGLGLAVCKRIVDAHHGEIVYETEAGRGTKFTMRLPM
jgi:hypothetical protein